MARLSGAFDGRRPDDFAGLLLESDHRGVVSSRSAYQLVAVDQGRFAVAAESGSMSLELFFQFLLPDKLSLGRAETDERPAEAEGVDLVAIDRRSAMGMIGAAVDTRFPEKFAG